MHSICLHYIGEFMKIIGIDCHVLLDPKFNVESTSSAQDDIVVIIRTVENIVLRMNRGYFSEEIAEVIEGVGYQYVVKAKEYTNLLEKAYDRSVKI